MVKSVLDNTINYPELRALDNEDEDYDAAVYDANILKKSVVIAVGQPRYAFIEKNIVYYPIYLIGKEKVVSQIGVYEILADKIVNVLDDDGDVSIKELGRPLLYSFITSSFLASSEKKSKVEVTESARPASPLPALLGRVEGEKKDVDEQSQVTAELDNDVDDDDDEEIDIKLVEDGEVNELEEQGAIDAKRERDKFVEKKENLWIERFLSNDNYDIVDNEGAGDCLFATIRDGLKSVGQDITVDGMRAILVDHADKGVFENYRTLYSDAFVNLQNIQTEQRKLAKQHRELKVRKSQAKDRNVQAVLVAEAEEVAQKHNDIKDQKVQAESFLSEFSFMKGIDTLEAFHARLQTCEFWGDTWAISTLEMALNVKLVLFSKEAYDNGDLDNVLQCGQMNDNTLEERGIFEPQYYIMLDYTGDHYKLVKYKTRGAFTFKELPYDIKRLIIDKCLERQAGAYYLIPEFREFMTKLHVSPVMPDSNLQSDLYKPHTIFQFYSKSNDKPKPGSGSGEEMGPEGVSSYNELAAIPKWRRKLSNFWEQQFVLDGKRWLTVEHYYQGSKFKKGHPEFYNQFSLDSGSVLSKSPEMAKAAGGKTGKYKKESLRANNIKLDNDFFAGRNKREMEEAMYAKFSQNSDLRKMLLATKSAKLQHFSRGSPPVVFDDLMRVRKKLSEE